MLVERTEITVRDGTAEAFDAVIRAEALPLLAAIDGALELRFGRGVENPAKFLLLVTWRDMEAHKAYNLTEACQTVRKLMDAYVEAAGMEHFELD